MSSGAGGTARDEPIVWFPTIRTGTGTDAFTIRLAAGLERRGIHAEITWLPHRAEFLPLSVAVPAPPKGTNIVHINSWLHRRFIPLHLPVVVTLHSCIHDPALNPYKSLLQKLYHRSWIWQREMDAINRARIVTAVSQFTAKQAQQMFSCSGIVPIHNWVDTEVFSPSSEFRPLRPFRLFFAGNAKRRLKGADLLPAIMRNLGSGYELWFTGELSDLGEAINLPQNIVALGRLNTVHEIVAAYRNCDALLFPTRLEGLALVSLEAQSCGLPVIATDCSSLPEVVVDGETGYLCPRDDVQAFANAARKLGSDAKSCREMRSAARRRAQDFFSEEYAIEKYVALYRSL